MFATCFKRIGLHLRFQLGCTQAEPFDNIHTFSKNIAGVIKKTVKNKQSLQQNNPQFAALRTETRPQKEKNIGILHVC